MNKNHFTYLLILAMFLWGGGWSALKVLTYNQNMEVIVFWRFFLMSISFLPIIYFMKKPLILTKNGAKFVLASSILNISFMVSSFFGIKGSLAGDGGVIITTLSPIITFLILTAISKKIPNKKAIIGIVFGISGGIFMLKSENLEMFFHTSNIYFLLCASIWAGVTILSQHSKEHIHPVHYSFYISVIATLFSFFYAFGNGISDVFNEGKKFWIALIYLSVFGQSIATTIFFIASGELGSKKTSSFMFLVPIFSLLIAHFLLDEPIKQNIVIGGTLSIIALYLINKKTKLTN